MTTRNGPLLTLLAGAVLGGGLLVASMIATPPDQESDAVPAADSTPEPVVETQQPTPTPTPEPTEEAEPVEEVAEPSPEPVTYVGYVDGGGASVAVIVTGDEAIAYVCDGAAVEAWLEGGAEDGRLDLSGANGSLTGSYDAEGATGETSAGDRTWTFTIAEVAAPEGLYRFADTIAGGADVVAGWIVLPDGTQIGAITADGVTRPAPELDLATGTATVDGETITAERQGEEGGAR
jgi:hypothetical protein